MTGFFSVFWGSGFRVVDGKGRAMQSWDDELKRHGPPQVRAEEMHDRAADRERIFQKAP